MTDALVTHAQTDLTNVVASMKSHTLHMSLLTFAGLVLALMFTGGVYLHSVQSYDKLIVAAETRDQVYQKSVTDFEAQVKADQSQILQLAQQKAQVETQVVYRDKVTDAAVQAVLAPAIDTTTLSSDLQSAYQFPPVKLDGDLFEFTKPETQSFVATKLDRDRLAVDLVDQKTETGLTTQANTKLSADLAGAQMELTQAQIDIQGFKKVAVKSKWKTFLGTAEKVGLFVGGIYLGHKL